MSLKKLQKILFYSIIFLIPSNLAKHWPQNWSLVNGILVDYLIPTLYLTDILILLLMGLWLAEFLIQNSEFRIKNHFKIFGFCFVILFYVLGSWFYILNKPAAIYKLIKLFEFGLFSLYTKYHFAGENRLALNYKIKNLIKVLTYSVIWQSVLAIFQWFNQGSIFAYWFFGEQPYTSSTSGIKLVNFFGRLMVPAYGTFPHPNVLAGFLTISLGVILLYLNRGRDAVITLFTFFLGVIALFLTFSLPALIVLVFSILYLIFKKRKVTGLPVTVLLFFIIGFFSMIYHTRLMEPSSLQRRLQLTNIALKMWLSSPVFGVGLNNFVVRMEEFGAVISNMRFLQPVHNIYLLVLAETGIIGVIGLISLIGLIFRKRQKTYSSLLIYFLFLLFLGLFDHYFFTIQQGMLMFSLVLGLLI